MEVDETASSSLHGSQRVIFFGSVFAKIFIDPSRPDCQLCVSFFSYNNGSFEANIFPTVIVPGMRYVGYNRPINATLIVYIGKQKRTSFAAPADYFGLFLLVVDGSGSVCDILDAASCLDVDGRYV
jgi:hypothetical protein